MNITPAVNYYQNNAYSTRNNTPKFTANIDFMKPGDTMTLEKDEIEKVVEMSRLYGGLVGFGLTVLAVSGIAACSSHEENKLEDKFLEKVQTIYNSKGIKKDTFKVQDMTGDEKPDIILYKKDGSKVVIDLAAQEVLQETKTLDVIQ